MTYDVRTHHFRSKPAMKRILIAFACFLISLHCFAAAEVQAEPPPWADFIGEFKGESTIVTDDMGEHTAGQRSTINIKFAPETDTLAVYIDGERIDQLPEYQIAFPDKQAMTIAWAGDVFVLPARILFNLKLQDNKLIGDKQVTLFSKDRHSNRIRERNTVYQLLLYR